MAVFYQSESVALKPTGDTNSQTTLPTLQSVGVNFSAQRNNVQRLGKFSVMPYRSANQWPTVNFQSEYIPTGYDVEQALGLMGTGAMETGTSAGPSSTSIVDALTISSQYSWSDIDVAIREMVLEGTESAFSTLSISEGVLTNYSFQASVGQAPKVSFSMEGLDAGVSTSSFSVDTPSDLSPTLRPQDMQLYLPTGLFGIADNGVHVQSVNIGIPLGRTPLIRLGEQKAFSRELQSPVIVTAQISAIMSGFKATSSTTDSDEMTQLVAGKFIDDDFVVRVWQPVETGSSTTQMINFVLRKPYLENIGWSNSVGGYTAVDLQFSIPCAPVDDGFGQTDGESNVIISGNLDTSIVI